MARFAQTGGKGVMVKKVGNTASINHQSAAQSAQRYALSPSHGAATQGPKVTDRTGPGRPAPTHESRSISSHNDVNRFTANINMHHSYKGPNSKSIGNDQEMQQQDTGQKSNNRTPSGGGTIRSKAARKMAQVKKVTGSFDVMSENTQPGGNRTGLSNLANRIARKGGK